MLNEAIVFATKAHEGQFRKGTMRPYIIHPIAVADIVMTMTWDEEVIAAAVLHDTIEDCPGVTEEILRERFGNRVASLVRCESEDKSKTWEERKSDTIRSLWDAPRELKMIALADKLANMRDIAREYPFYGEDFWARFRMQSKLAIGWYYKAVRDALGDTLWETEAFEEYDYLVDKIFGSDESTVDWDSE